MNKHRGKDKFMPQDDVFAILKAYGIPTVETVKVKKQEELEKAANMIGYPLVLKVDSPKIVHKTEVGGVALRL